MAITAYWQLINNALLNEKFWLPNNLTWAKVSPPSNGKVNYTSVSDLLVPIPLALILVAIRYPLEKYCFHPLALYLGIKPKIPKEIQNIAVLERAYLSRSEVNDEQIVGLSKQLDWTERQVERWLRLRRARDKPSTLVKFTETSWRFLYYSCSFCYGCFCVWDKQWVRDTKLLVLDHPHEISTDCWWYCMITCGFYWSLLGTHFFDVKRKDFIEMIVHHFVSIFLVSLTWIINAHRFLCMGFLMFDLTDVFVESTKLAKYAQFQKTAAVLFGLLVITWMGIRWVWYPFCILRMMLFDVLDIYEPCPMYFLSCFLLFSMLALNTFWTYFILKVCFHGLAHGPSATHDTRSSGEEEISDEAEPFVQKNLISAKYKP